MELESELFFSVESDCVECAVVVVVVTPRHSADRTARTCIHRPISLHTYSEEGRRLE